MSPSRILRWLRTNCTAAYSRTALSFALVLSVLLISTGCFISKLAAQEHPSQSATADSLPHLDDIVNSAIARDEIPGAVLLVSHNGRVVHRQAYGSRAMLPQSEAMTVDTIFDLASLTKIFATTASVMKLVEQGKLRLSDPVVKYIPELGTEGATEWKREITLRHLLTHTAGFAPDADVPGDWSGVEPVLREIYAEPLVAPPGARFIYSDSGFILLGEIVRRVSGVPLNEFAEQNIFKPMGMQHTQFLPPQDWLPRIAPTEEVDLPDGAKAGSGRGHVLRGTVHDPRSRGMGGVAGHAGLFSTADDLAIYCNMILAGGTAPNGKRMFATATIHGMTSVETPPWVPSLRGLGWDIDSLYSAPRGELFPIGSFGHTGFTGTSVWIDPASKTFVILLANSVHPYVRPAISSLRSKIATAVAADLNIGSIPGSQSPIARSIGAATRGDDTSGVAQRGAHTLTGIDVLESENFAPLAGKRVGLITNASGVDRNGRSTIDLLAHAPGVKLVTLFSPEHGIRGEADQAVASSTDPATGLPIYSLYGETTRPTDAMLEGIDALVFDIQDAGVRFYTYITTMAYTMEAAAKHHLPYYVLDRPDPLGGELIEGPMLDRDRTNFVGYFAMPVRMGMTLGEMARMFDAENKLDCDLHVIQMKSWRRADWFEDTGLPWVSPSPNLRSPNAEVLYAGIEILQSADISVGRGTDRPFEHFGAPWIDAVQLADYLNSRFVPGVRFLPTRFTPSSGVHKGEECQGVEIVVTDRRSVYSVLMGMEIAAALAKFYPQKFDVTKIVTLVGNANAVARLKNGDAPGNIVSDWSSDIEAFRKMRSKYLLYK
jgi:uncharacterized protein YbbC (DUF1343 family)/CubicO group peptidase (beta-lactamase class C family)